MPRINLDRMSVRDLNGLAKNIAAAIATKKIQEEQALKAKIAHLAAESGYSVDELFGTKRRSLAGRKVAAKYRNPDDASQTWAGRGRQPLWFASAVKKYGKPDKLLIK
jgi:DNA-binding protein H-NS